jgi:diaminohydroxyphosphoribosylaminopyrimidine deaminase / 5-amino-6-(5-phosphoribosylamino)uracil reductase
MPRTPAAQTNPADDVRWMRVALRLARHGLGRTSPNPAVGAVLVRRGLELGRGWHHAAGEPHAEIEALADAARRNHHTRGATLYVTLEPCSTHGRTSPCTDALQAANLRRVVVGAIDPNPRHRGRGLGQLRRAGIEVTTGVLETECTRLNEAFNHWIVRRTPWVTLKAAMTLDGKIATPQGQSKWITGPTARRHAHLLRSHADAILVGVNTILADDPQLTARTPHHRSTPRRFILDSHARTPVHARVVTDSTRHLTTIVVTRAAPRARIVALTNRVAVWIAPARHHRVSLHWLLSRLGAENVTSLLVEGGGEVHAAFLQHQLAHRVAFFYAPMVLTGRDARKAVAGRGARHWDEVARLLEPEWRRLGPDLMLTARIDHSPA